MEEKEKTKEKDREQKEANERGPSVLMAGMAGFYRNKKQGKRSP